MIVSVGIMSRISLILTDLTGGWTVLLSEGRSTTTYQSDLQLLPLDLLQGLHGRPPGVGGVHGVGVERLVPVTHRVVDQLGAGLSVDQLHGLPHQLQVPGVGVHRDHLPAHGRHHQGVHPDVAAHVCGED